MDFAEWLDMNASKLDHRDHKPARCHTAELQEDEVKVRESVPRTLAQVWVCVQDGPQRTTELLGPPVDVDPSPVTLFGVGSDGCTETLTVSTWVTAKTRDKQQSYL